jgi:formiminotetrahydrofolate cyclodeaminase
MEDMAGLTLDGFLERVADRAPTPGGGSVAALAGALATALARMVTAYTGPKNPDNAPQSVKTVAARLRRADELLRALITRDAAAYAAMSACKPKRGQATPNPDYREAVLVALAVPMETAAALAEVLTTLDAFKAEANKHLLSDLGAAAVLADATARAARFMVQVNSPELDDPSLAKRLLADIDAIVGRCKAAGASIEAFVNTGLEAQARARR